MVVPRLRTVPPLAARCSAPADFASLRVLGAPAASRPPLLTSSLVALPASLGSSYRPALRWPGIPGLRSASRCSSIQHGRTTPSHRPALTLARCSVSSHRPRLRRRGVPALRTPFRRVLAPPAASRPSIAHCASLRVLAPSALRASDGQRPGRECIFTANASICSTKNARNDVHAVISDLSLVLLILYQCSVNLRSPLFRYTAAFAPGRIFPAGTPGPGKCRFPPPLPSACGPRKTGCE